MSTYQHYYADPDYSYELKAGSRFNEEDQLEEWSIVIYYSGKVILDDWGRMTYDEAEVRAETLIAQRKEAEDPEDA